MSATSPEGRHDGFFVYFSFFPLIGSFSSCFSFYFFIVLRFIFIECVCRACRTQYNETSRKLSQKGGRLGAMGFLLFPRFSCFRKVMSDLC